VEEKTSCAGCSRIVCESGRYDLALDSCPIKDKADLIKTQLDKYNGPDTHEFARQAAVQEYECYIRLPEGLTTIKPRILETMEFAAKMGYEKLGMAFCGGLRNEAKVINQILENNGFEVVSVSCKVGGIPKETIGITEEQKIAGPGCFEAMCNPITQAEILNAETTEFNIMVGLCVGHDSLFLQHVKAPTTVLVVKDRVFGHNPAAALYLSGSYYKKLLHKKS
jgi:uncharacterized metal-binding protein